MPRKQEIACKRDTRLGGRKTTATDPLFYQFGNRFSLRFEVQPFLYSIYSTPRPERRNPSRPDRTDRGSQDYQLRCRRQSLRPSLLCSIREIETEALTSLLHWRRGYWPISCKTAPNQGKPAPSPDGSEINLGHTRFDIFGIGIAVVKLWHRISGSLTPLRRRDSIGCRRIIAPGLRVALRCSTSCAKSHESRAADWATHPSPVQNHAS